MYTWVIVFVIRLAEYAYFCATNSEKMAQLVLHLGSNQGLRNQHLQKAKMHLTARLGTLLKASSVYETGAWGKTDQRPFLNQALLLETTLRPLSVLYLTQQIELELGRVRATHWGPRIIDIDLIFYDQKIVQAVALTIPHPLLQARRFVLTPLAEIIPQWRHPVSGASVYELLRSCEDAGWVRRVK